MSNPLVSLFHHLFDQENIDVILYSGVIDNPQSYRMVRDIEKRARRKDALLILTTFGGDAHAAYRIARALQHYYTEYSVLIDGVCKSAGTLIALGSAGLIMGELGELGPLDIQLYKPNEVGEWSSSLTPVQALHTLLQEAYTFFEERLFDLRKHSMLQITTPFAADLVERLTQGLFAPIMEQVDPIRIGELQRESEIALEYGRRLIAGRKKPLKDGVLDRLVSRYPSHRFIIDRLEAQELFGTVREPSALEQQLVDYLRPMMDNMRKVKVASDDESTTEFSYFFVGDLVDLIDKEETQNDDQPQPEGTTGDRPQDRKGPAEEIRGTSAGGGADARAATDPSPLSSDATADSGQSSVASLSDNSP